MTAPTSVRLPEGGLAELQFTPGVWTDITDDIEQEVQTFSIRYGRSSAFSQPQAATLSGLALRNDTGRYDTVARRSLFRYSYNPAGTTRYRFTGYVKQLQPTLVEGDQPFMILNAICQLDRYSRVKMLPPIRQEITLDFPAFYWPLTDDQGSLTAAEQSGNGGPVMGTAGVGPTAPVFGDNGPGFGDGTGVKFTATGQFLTANVPFLLAAPTINPLSFEFWVQTSSATDQVPVAMYDTARSMTLSVTIAGASTGRPAFNLSGTAGITGPNSVIDGQWHHFAVTYGGGTWTFYIDGASAGTLSFGHSSLNLIQVGQITGNMGQVAVYHTTLDGSTIFQHNAAGDGYAGDRTDVRISRFLGFGEVGDIGILDFGAALVGTYPQAGKDVAGGCDDMATTEGGGSVFYITPDGRPRFTNRRYRDSRTPKLTIDAVADLDPSVYQPSRDDMNLVTVMTANRSSQSGTQTAQTYDSGASDRFVDEVATYTMGTADGYATGDQDALALAQYIVGLQSEDATRFPQIAVDLASAAHDLYDTVGQLQIGDRIRLTNIPAVAGLGTQLDFFLEGWTESPDLDSYKFVMDVSAADVPGARAIADLSTADGPDVAAL